MKDSNFWNYVFIIIVLLHILAGFAYLVYKLSPRKKGKNKTTNDV
jgi:hypothetical protein